MGVVYDEGEAMYGGEEVDSAAGVSSKLLLMKVWAMDSSRWYRMCK